MADSLAPEISETINNIGEFIQKLKNDVSNYVGGIQDAKKMKANFKFAEKYAETLLKDPTLPDSTRQKLSNAYQTALETKDFFCNGTDCNTVGFPFLVQFKNIHNLSTLIMFLTLLGLSVA